jgi:CRISPR system Cascade subunit CasA
MDIQNHFNLLDEPWVPIAGANKISLRQVFSESHHRTLGGNPIEKIALMKLLLAIAQTAYTPQDDEDWIALGITGMAQKCLIYLDHWQDRFWLYGPKPFLQMPGIVKAAEQNFGAVLPEIATGNTTILMALQQTKPLSDAEKALLIVTLMGLALGGKKTDCKATLTPGYQKKKTSIPGPSVGFRGLLHNFLETNTLLQTLWLNLLTQEKIEQLPIYPAGLGTAPWEKMPEGEECETAIQLKKSLIGRLIPMSRFCLLSESTLHYSEGISHLTYKEGIWDPSIGVSLNKDTKAIWSDPKKQPWRWLTALLSFISAENADKDHFECTQIRATLPRARQQVDTLSIWSGGLKVSSNAGEQYVSGNDDFVTSRITLKSNLLGTTWYAQLKSEMAELDNLSKILYSSVVGYFKVLKAEGGPQASIATQLYWQLCERHFQAMVNACDDSEKITSVRKKIAYVVYKTYDTICANHTARQLDAWASTRPNLSKYLQTKCL